MYDIQGSPPQVRGKPDEVMAHQAEIRITPAGAGKTGDIEVWEELTQDHPRRCGENAATVIPYTAPRGSPPQVRGKPDSTHMPYLILRITPAGAGKTECPVSAV